jgi:uncharacterized protein (UPF0179 family)
MTEDKKPIITVVGLRQAKLGFSFLNEGILKECENCKLFTVCRTNLEVGRVYVVSEVRDKIFPCNVHEESVRVVEVVESNIETNIENRLAFPYGIITFQLPTCQVMSCVSYGNCSPQGLKSGDKCRILEVKGPTVAMCPLNRHLVSATLQRVVS